MTEQQPAPQRRGAAGDTRQKIMSTAEQLFAEQGYERTSLRQIADVIGIKDPSLYKHFSGKDALYSAVMERALQPLVDEVESWSGQLMLFDELLATPRKVVKLLARHPHAARLLQRELSNAGAVINPIASEWFGRLFSVGVQFRQKRDPDGTPPQTDAQQPSMKELLPLLAVMNVALGYFACAPLMASFGTTDPLSDEMLEAQSAVLDRVFKVFLMDL
jgi:AcrR family transcriptional regulator